jgi:uncharacterized protein (DUF849 family)
VSGSPHFVKACLNGARRVEDHQGVPRSPAELAVAARDAIAAGASAIHMHPRDTTGAESLDGSAISPAVAAVKAALGDGVGVGVSTGAWFLPDPADRLAAVSTWTDLPDFASVNIHEAGAVDLARALLDMGVGVEAGLWHAEGARTLVDSGLTHRCTRLLIEPLVQDLSSALVLAQEIEDEIAGVAPEVPRLLHGYGVTSWPIVDIALDRGLQTRIGLEDTVVGRDGSSALDNADLVRQALTQGPHAR